MITDFTKEINFFHEIAPQTLKLAENTVASQTSHIFKKQDNTLNYVTQVDITVENTIVTALKNRFPSDLILSEEGYSNESIPSKGRIWVIDPICGTANLGRGVPFFATNVALVEDKKIIAACVIDHMLKRYIWSTLTGPIFINSQPISTRQKTGGVLIDIDLISSARLDTRHKQKFATFVDRIITSTDYVLISYISSLNFAYCALGTVDAYASALNHVWDVAAANFLITKAGGIVTDIEGHPWTLNSTSVLAAKDEILHKQLQKLFHS